MTTPNATLPELINSSLSMLGGNMNNSFSRQLSTLLQQQGINTQNLCSPSIDIVDSESTINISMDASGVSRDSIDVSFFNNTIVITGEREEPELSSGAVYLRKEIVYGNFERKIRIPISITQRESVSIDLNNGILIISIDKTIENKNKFSVKL